MMYYINDEDPAKPVPRKKKQILIPPATFSGPAWGPQDSGHWTPPSSVRLLEGYVSASSDGTGACLLQIIRLDPPRQETTLQVIVLGATERKKYFDFSIEPSIDTLAAPILTPFEPVFVRMWTSSSHYNITVQMIGEEP